MLLRGAHRAADHLKNIGWRSAVAVLHSHGNSDDVRRPQLARGMRGNRCDQPAIREAARTDLHRLEKSGEGAAGADGVHKVSLRKYDWVAASKIRGYHRHGDAQVFKLARLENALNQSAKPLVASQAQA